MTKVLYARYDGSTIWLADKMRKGGVEVDTLEDKFNDSNRFTKLFLREYAPRLGDYDALIAHLEDFWWRLDEIFEKFPRLKIAVVTNLPGDYRLVDSLISADKKNRFLVCGYSYSKLIPFVKGEWVPFKES